MNKTIIFLLAIILLIFVILNNITIVKTEVNGEANCSQTVFGCCPDGVNSKINFYGTNCPAYNPGPGYYPNKPRVKANKVHDKRKEPRPHDEMHKAKAKEHKYSNVDSRFERRDNRQYNRQDNR
jgi:hypothetical protein